MRAVRYLCFAACCLALASCGTFGKKSPFKPKEPSSQSANPGWPPSSSGADSALSDSTPPAKTGGLLAGRVLDSYDRPPPPTYIRVLPAGSDTKNAPLEVATDSQEYFTIQGLQAGQHYQLFARTRDGETKLAGTTWATPPNPRILIFVSQDFATPNTPAYPSATGSPRREVQRAGYSALQAAGCAVEHGHSRGQRINPRGESTASQPSLPSMAQRPAARRSGPRCD